MKNRGSFLLILGVVLFFYTTVCGQDTGIQETMDTDFNVDFDEDSLIKIPFIGLIGRYDGDNIKLRWGPSVADIWLRGIKYGYYVYRSEGKDFEELSDSEPVLIDSVYPYPKDKWIAEAEFEKKDDSYFNIALQCIYGEWNSKALGNDLESMLTKNDELLNRFGFSLMAADFDFNAALYSGLAYLDRNIDPEKMYLYYVYAAIPDSMAVFVNHGFVMVDPKEETLIPDIVPEVIEGEKSVSIYWSREVYDNHYTAYWIERSLDGKNFERLNSTPYINPLSDDEETYSPNHVYIDSVDNYILHTYRLGGITPFGELVMSTHTFKAQGVDKTPPPQPSIIEGTYLSDTKIKLQWKMEECTDLKGFKIKKGYDYDLPMYDLGVMLSFEDSVFTDEKANNVLFHYYIVEAIDTAGNISGSLPFLVKFNDTIPPSPPTGLLGSCDSLGMVTISWNRNPELDNFGYKVMFANDSLHEFSLITGEAIRDTFFRHQISLSTLTEKIYFKVYAVDMRYNISKLSEILEVTRFDTIPPLEPLFYDYKVFNDSAIIYWYSSRSKDAVSQELYRSTDQLEWNLITSMDNTIGEYIDYDLVEGNTYFYKVIVYDKSKLKAESPYPMVISPLTRYIIDVPFEFNVREQDGRALIEWKSEATNAKITIYKSFGENKLQKYRTFDVQQTSYIDNNVFKGSNYNYSAILNFQNGKTSNFSETISFELVSED